jgi:phosphonopyruvate decarboxylase
MMLQCRETFEQLRANGIGFFAGVPDSALADFCAYVTDHAEPQAHIITANEGSAVALATGYHLATGDTALVYMQNSGQGNAINPLVSLADPEVYAIPMLLLIGWRGEPGKPDEPQHVKQGKITLPLLECLGLPYQILPVVPEAAAGAIEKAVETARRNSAPYALVVKRGSFAPYPVQKRVATPYAMSREQAVKLLVNHLNPSDVIVSTTGKASRELFEYRIALGQEPGRDFLTVGSMGHASQIALGMALHSPNRQICCFDGDGALLMHMGSLATVGHCRPGNFKHFVLNNGSHDSVGGQPTVGLDIDIPALARAYGYPFATRAETAEDLAVEITRMMKERGPALMEIRVNRGARSDLGRPTSTPLQNKQAFIRFIRS